MTISITTRMNTVVWYKNVCIGTVDSWRVWIVCTRPSCRATRSLVAIDNTNDWAIRPGDRKKPTYNDDEYTPPSPEVPWSSPWFAPVVVQPHATHRLKTHECTKEGSHKRNKSAKYRDCARNNVWYDRISGSAADPDHPMRGSAAREVNGAAEESQEEVFRGKLYFMLVESKCQKS